MGDAADTTGPGGRFMLAMYAFDGEPVRADWIESGRLARRWIDFCHDRFDFAAPRSTARLDGPLSHVDVKITNGPGCALLTLSIRGLAASSFALAAGVNPAAEGQVLAMFVESLRRAPAVAAAAAKGPAGAFNSVLTTIERPAAFGVMWPPGVVAESDLQLVRDLALHSAAAFFEAWAKGTTA